jgi:hypothetical protein
MRNSYDDKKRKGRHSPEYETENKQGAFGRNQSQVKGAERLADKPTRNRDGTDDSRADTTARHI